MLVFYGKKNCDAGKKYGAHRNHVEYALLH